MPMTAMPSSARSEFYAGLLRGQPSDEPPPVRPTVLENDRPSKGQPPLRKRASRALSHLLIAFCSGVAATLAWQSVGDAARAMIVNSYPQLGWLAPQAEPVAQNAPNVIALAAQAGSSADQQQLNAKSLDLDAVRQSLDRIATSMATGQDEIMRSVERIASSIVAGQEQATRTIERIASGIVAGQEQTTRTIDRVAGSQEQLARSIDQLTTGQDQIAGEITKLQAARIVRRLQELRAPAAAGSSPARNPVLRSSQAPISLAPAKNQADNLR
jgi:hypothetical protein